eukprot:c11953_g1_i1.p1 GENE.c11953_g1_i1~~c11953_g1_i1.p1  ORF type:complete len:366 (-),score=91.98 c11953_g1_i1:168-1265(-)
MALLIAVPITSAFVSIRLGQSGILTRRMAVEEVGEFCFGAGGYYFTLLAVVLNDFGRMVARVVVIGDMIGPIQRHLKLTGVPQLGLVAIACIGVAFPLTLYRDLKSIKVISTVALFSNLLLIVLLAAQAGRSGLGVSDFNQGGAMGERPLLAFGTICFISASQEFVFEVFRATGTQDIRTWRTLMTISTTLTTSMCCALGLAGLFAFGPDLNSNVLNNFSDDNPAANTFRIITLASLLIGFPVDLFIARQAFVKLLDLETSPSESSKDPTLKHFLVTSFLFFSAVFIGARLNDLGAVQSAVGGVGGTLLGFILPAIFVLRTNQVTDGRIFCVFGDYVLLVVLGACTFACFNIVWEEGLLGQQSLT